MAPLCKHHEVSMSVLSGVCACAGACASKGRALVLAPYFSTFETCVSDESEEIASILQTAGYTVTFKCYDATQCPGGGVSAEDFKNLEQYAVIAVSTHGDSADDGSSPIIATRQQYSDGYQSDWDAGRVELLADGTMMLAPRFFDAYTNQIGGAIVYISACRSVPSMQPLAQ
jgi:hypothetical protein